MQVDLRLQGNLDGEQYGGGRPAWPTALGLGPSLLEVHGFESHPPHLCFYDNHTETYNRPKNEISNLQT